MVYVSNGQRISASARVVAGCDGLDSFVRSGIEDTEPLRAAIGRALQEDSSDAIVSYVRARKATIQWGVNRNTGRLTSLLFTRRGKYFKRVVRTLNRLLAVPPVRRRFLRGVAMIPAEWPGRANGEGT